MKKNRIDDSMKQLFKAKDILGLKKLSEENPKYAEKAKCYISRLNRKGYSLCKIL